MTDGDFRERFLEGDALGTWVSIGHPAIVEAAARAGSTSFSSTANTPR